jgi:2-polyprenyl-3-methyl-5-hydroxy-6-metoxy-1,4-benzoquinol methylase
MARARNCYEAALTGDIQDPATVATLPKGEFDFVMFGDVLEHLNSPEKALEIIKPLLKPDGHILICVPSIVHWSIRMRVLKGQFEYTETGPLDRTHVRFFTPNPRVN